MGWTFSNPDYASQTGNATVTIDQAGSTVTVTPASSSVTYDAQQHGATATWASTGTDDEGGSLTVTYVGIDGTDYASSTTAPTEVGEYQASASFAGNADHTGSSNTADIAITPATATITVTGFSGAYDGTAHGVVSSSATGVGGATIAGLSWSGTTYTNAPGGLVGWTFSDPDYASQTGNATVTIDQAGSTVTVTPASSSVTYDAQQHGATATWASTGTDDEGGSLTVTYVGIDGTDYASSTTAPTEVGEYQASASFAGNADHTGSSNTADIAITPATATITVTGFSGAYDGAAHGVVSSSATGVGGATIAGLSVNSTTYRDAPGGLVGWSFSNPDYTSQSGDATVTIGQAGSTVTVTPALSSVTYNAQQHGATATWASTGTDDEGGSLTVTYVGIDGTDYASSTTAPTEVGEYQASVSFAGNADHTGSSNTADIAITPATATITVTGFSGAYRRREAHGVVSSSATGVGARRSRASP